MSACVCMAAIKGHQCRVFGLLVAHIRPPPTRIIVHLCLAAIFASFAPALTLADWPGKIKVCPYSGDIVMRKAPKCVAFFAGYLHSNQSTCLKNL